MATPTIPNGEEYFFPIIYEGNGGGQRVGKFVPFTDNGTIDNSVIFNRGDNPKLSRLPSSDGNRRTLTYSVWIKRGILGTENHFISCYDGSSTDNESMWEMQFLTDNTVSISRYSDYILQTTRTFEDTSKWYHYVMAIDTTQGTASDRVKLYVDGDEITTFDVDNRSNITQNFDTAFNNTSDTCVIGARINNTTKHWSGYMAEINLVDGQALTPASFGLTDTSTGRWIPKTLSGITYGTNGFRLEFGDSSALGDDTSGNTNDFTATNLASTDQTTDSPTQNHATFDPNFSGSIGLSEGNLVATQTLSNNWESAFIGMPIQSGKYYFELTADVVSTYFMLGVTTLDGYANAKNTYIGDNADSYSVQIYPGFNDYVYYGGSNYDTGQSTSVSNGDVIGVCYDADKGAYFIAVNNTWTHSGDPANGTNPVFTGYTPNKLVYLGISYYVSGAKFTLNTGQKSFTYTPPTGFVALQQDNLPETVKGVSGLVWTKNRDSTDNHQLYDSSRGKQLVLASNATTNETTVTDGLQKFLAGGQQIEDDVSINTSGESYVSWNWVANSGSTSSNTDGSITSTVQANTTAGFSIVQYTGTGSAGTIGHGLSSAPEFIILKRLVGVQDWLVGNTPSGWTKHLFLNGTDALATTSITWNNTAPTSSVFSVGTGNSSNKSGDPFIGYVWHSVDGFSKIGSYTGNGSSDGTFIYTGFKPAWVMIKNISGSYHWNLFDSARDTFNPVDRALAPSSTAVETNFSTSEIFDFLSNGFKLRCTLGGENLSGNTYIYMAFAEHPFVGDGVSPVTAR